MIDSIYVIWSYEAEVINYIDRTGMRGTTEWTRIVVDGEEVDATWRIVDGAVLVQVRHHRTKRVSKRVCSPTMWAMQAYDEPFALA